MKEIFGMRTYTPGVGAMIKGWDISEEHFRDPSKLPVVDLAIMTHACPRDCGFCFTNKNPKTLTLPQIKDIINQLAERQTYAVDYLGEGEPTLDKNFFEIIEYTSHKGVIPLVYTEAALKLNDLNFVKRLYDSGASVLPKCDSLWNKEYQNRVVRSRKYGDYFLGRNKAIENLAKAGFNNVTSDGLTRMGFDMVLTSENMHEVERTLRYCRENNFYIMFGFHLPSGRTVKTANEEITTRRSLHELVQNIDFGYGITRQSTYNNFLTGPCKEYLMIRGDGRVQVCPGNEYVLGYVAQTPEATEILSINEIEEKMLRLFPCHSRINYSGNCPYRPGF